MNHNSRAEDVALPDLTHGESITLDVDPCTLYTPAGIKVQPGQSFSFTANGKWKDWFIPCDYRGWGGGWLTRFARVKGQPLFRLCASIGKDDCTAFPVDTSQRWTVPDSLPPDGDRQLFLFANDLRWMYWNNRALGEAEGGPLRVSMKRVA